MKNIVSLVAAGVIAAGALTATEARAEKPVVAIFPIKSPNNHNLGLMGHNAQPLFVTQLVKSGKVRVVNDALMKKAVKRFELEMGGLFDTKKIRRVGKWLKVDYIVTGQISWGGDGFTMTVHVTNIETLQVEMADEIDFRDIPKFKRAVRAAGQKIAGVISGEGGASKKSTAFLNLDARAFEDTADRLINTMEGLKSWRYEGEIDDEDRGKRKVHVKLRYGRPKPGTPLQVFEEGLGENDSLIGVLYVVENDDGRSGFVARWIKEKDKRKRKRGDFGLGARVSNDKYKYRISIGRIEDLAEDNAALVEMFREKLEDALSEKRMFKSRNNSKFKAIALDLGRGGTRKKNLKKLHKLGADFLLEGKFIGDPGRRRADFKLISTVTGEVWGNLKFETRI